VVDAEEEAPGPAALEPLPAVPEVEPLVLPPEDPLPVAPVDAVDIAVVATEDAPIPVDPVPVVGSESADGAEQPAARLVHKVASNTERPSNRRRRRATAPCGAPSSLDRSRAHANPDTIFAASRIDFGAISESEFGRRALPQPPHARLIALPKCLVPPSSVNARARTVSLTLVEGAPFTLPFGLMRTTIVGLAAPRKMLEAVLARIVSGPCEIREADGWVWGALPLETRRRIVEQIAAALGRELVGIDVEMSLGGRGRDLTATRYVVPQSGRDQDLTADAREILHEWTADSTGGFDEDEAISELAWELVGDGSTALDEGSECFEDRWADALVASLVKSGGIELRGKLRPTGQIAHHLQVADEDGFAENLLDVLVDSTAVAEVFVDEDELERVLQETRPTR